MSHIIFDTVLLLMFSRISDINNVDAAKTSSDELGQTEETFIRRGRYAFNLPGHRLSTSVCHLDLRLTPTRFGRWSGEWKKNSVSESGNRKQTVFSVMLY